MKKIVLSLVAVIALTAAVNAQAGFRLILKGGATISQVTGKALEGNYLLGYQLGGSAEIDFSRAIGIQPEILFSESSGRTSNDASSIFTNLNPNQNVYLNYLSIPLLLRINVDKLLTLNVGPQYSILVNNHQTTYQNGQAAFSNGDFAMVGGVQLNLKVLRIYGRYVIGLNNINEINQQDRWKNEQVQLGIGLKL